MDPSFYKEYFELERAHWWFLARRNIITSLIERFIGVPHGQTIFDAGCGSGFFVRYLQKMGYQAAGADGFGPAVDYGRQQQGIQGISIMDQEKIDAPDASYDCVLALDVLEHLEDETKMIREMKRVLKPGGIMIVTVPAYRFLWGVQDTVAHHFRRYVRGEIVDTVVRGGGVRPIFSSYYNSLLFVPIAAVRLLFRWFHIDTQRHSDYEIGPAWVNSLLYWIFNCEAYLLRLMSFPFGVSIVVVLKKLPRS